MPDVKRSMLRAVGALNVAVYRRSGGRVMGKVRGIPVLLLTVSGRKTGVEHTSPVAYFEKDGNYVVTGSAGGAPAEPQWFRNLRSAQHAVIEVGSRRIGVAVTIAGPQERETLWQQLLTCAPFFANYQAKVTREIPMAVLTPAA